MLGGLIDVRTRPCAGFSVVGLASRSLEYPGNRGAILRDMNGKPLAHCRGSSCGSLPIWYSDWYKLFGTAIGTILNCRKSLLCKDLRVEDRGLEPLTSCMPCKRSPN